VKHILHLVKRYETLSVGGIKEVGVRVRVTMRRRVELNYNCQGHQNSTSVAS